MKLPLFLSLLLLATLASCDHVVHTSSGPVRGVTVASGKVEAYLGIPYAEPPVGQLRFAKPVPKAPWTEVLEAAEMPPPCVQMRLGDDEAVSSLSPSGLDRMSEDCLFLNVWVPRSKEKAKTVMFFIHGGSFIMGASNTKVFDGARLAEHGDVVVVTINYRVGSLGFFSVYNEDAPGNQGLHDQILALRWTKDNARLFDGDPDSITIFGQSAGSYSVSLHQLTTQSSDLFRRAILQSGSVVNPFYAVGDEEFQEIHNLYVQELACDDNSPEVVLACLRNLPAENFAKADSVAFTSGHKFVLHPRFGEELFPDGAVNLFKQGRFKRSEVMIGVTRNEGSFALALTYEILGKAPDDNDWISFFNRTTAYEGIKTHPITETLLRRTTPEKAERIVRDYLEKECDGDSCIQAISHAIGDTLLVCGGVFQAEFQAARGDPVYFYKFDHRTAHSPFPEWTGVPHFEEVAYVFGNPLLGDWTEEEKELSRDVMDMWTTFAKTGNPNIPGGLEWPRFTAEDPKYYVIGRRDRVDSGPDNHRCDRWREIFLNTHTK